MRCSHLLVILALLTCRRPVAGAEVPWEQLETLESELRELDQAVRKEEALVGYLAELIPPGSHAALDAFATA